MGQDVLRQKAAIERVQVLVQKILVLKTGEVIEQPCVDELQTRPLSQIGAYGDFGGRCRIQQKQQ